MLRRSALVRDDIARRAARPIHQMRATAPVVAAAPAGSLRSRLLILLLPNHRIGNSRSTGRRRRRLIGSRACRFDYRRLRSAPGNGNPSCNSGDCECSHMGNPPLPNQRRGKENCSGSPSIAQLASRGFEFRPVIPVLLHQRFHLRLGQAAAPDIALHSPGRPQPCGGLPHRVCSCRPWQGLLFATNGPVARSVPKADVALLKQR